MDLIDKRVHELYWVEDVNCATTMLTCLGELFDVKYTAQTIDAAIGLHGAGGFRAQCGLVEGALMFIGIYYSRLHREKKDIAAVCRRFAGAFTQKFGALTCHELRPNGFTKNDPPHLCEGLTCEAAAFTRDFIQRETA